MNASDPVPENIDLELADMGQDPVEFLFLGVHVGLEEQRRQGLPNPVAVSKGINCGAQLIRHVCNIKVERRPSNRFGRLRGALNAVERRVQQERGEEVGVGIRAANPVLDPPVIRRASGNTNGQKSVVIAPSK